MRRRLLISTLLVAVTAVLLLGVPLAIAARAGRRPTRAADSLIRPMGVLLLIMALIACAAGIVGYALARKKMVFLLYPLSEDVPAGKHAASASTASSSGRSRPSRAETRCITCE